ncbi:MAG: cyclic nucleotide-binding domain-containing protein [Desulfobacteraceae bacterium]|jgi:CRP-like cAMP-binding protein
MIETSFLDNNGSMLSNLKNIDVLEPFEDQELQRLMEMSKIRKFSAGESIVKEGQTDTWLYILMFGRIKVSKNGKQVAVLDRKGEIFGEMGALNSARRSATVFAETDTVCLATDMFYLEKLTGNDKIAFGYVLYRLLSEILSRRLRQTTAALIQSKSRLNFKFW